MAIKGDVNQGRQSREIVIQGRQSRKNGNQGRQSIEMKESG